MTDYANADSNRVSTAGGVVQTAITGDASIDQCNAGTSIPCRVVQMNLVPGAAGYVACAINDSVNTAYGAIVPSGSTGGVLEIPIDDVNKLWFYGSKDTDKVNLTYRN